MQTQMGAIELFDRTGIDRAVSAASKRLRDLGPWKVPFTIVKPLRRVLGRAGHYYGKSLDGSPVYIVSDGDGGDGDPMVETGSQYAAFDAGHISPDRKLVVIT